MSGLDKIADSILQEARQKADEILSKAKGKAAEIEKDAAEKVEAFKRSSAEAAEREADKVFERFDSENRQQRKQALLRARSEVIADIIAQARAKIESLPDGEYFDLMRGICVKNAQKGEGKLYFAKRDNDRLPGDFVDRCNAEITNGSLTLAGSTDRIQSGFVIVYGKIEQNYSLDSIFEMNKNLIWDKVNEYLSAG